MKIQVNLVSCLFDGLSGLPAVDFFPEKPGPLGQVKDRWLCLGFLCLKDERPTSKGEHCGNY
jgi:hypothetical protein